MTTPSETHRTIALNRGIVALVDAEDFERLSRWRWEAHWSSRTQSFYVERQEWVGGCRLTIQMSREIMGCTTGDGLHVDHANHDTLDNRRHNLRVCTVAQNQWNSGEKTNSTTGIKGVYRRRNGYRVQIRVNRKRISLGDVKTIEEARALYADAAHKFHGEFALVD